MSICQWTTATTTTVLWPLELPGSPGTRRNNRPLAYPDHLSFISFFSRLQSIISCLFSLHAWQFFAQPLSKSFLVYLLVWSPPLHICRWNSGKIFSGGTLDWNIKDIALEWNCSKLVLCIGSGTSEWQQIRHGCCMRKRWNKSKNLHKVLLVCGMQESSFVVLSSFVLFSKFIEMDMIVKVRNFQYWE